VKAAVNEDILQHVL